MRPCREENSNLLSPLLSTDPSKVQQKPLGARAQQTGHKEPGKGQGQGQERILLHCYRVPCMNRNAKELVVDIAYFATTLLLIYQVVQLRRSP